MGCGTVGELDDVGALTGRWKKPFALPRAAEVVRKRRALCAAETAAVEHADSILNDRSEAGKSASRDLE